MGIGEEVVSFHEHSPLLSSLKKTADELGPSISAMARRLLDNPLPWTRMRSVQALISLARRYGAERVDATCVTALAHDMLSMHRLRRMLETAVAETKPEPTRTLPPGRFLRPTQHFALNPTTTTAATMTTTTTTGESS